MYRTIYLLLFALAAMAVLSGSLSAATPSIDPVILSIDVSGNRVVEKETILARLESHVGQKLDRKVLSQDVRKLYKSGDFSDVSVSGVRDTNGIRLTFRIKEYPLIGKVTLKGNSEVKTRDIKLRLKLKPGRVFNPHFKHADLNTIRKGYLKKGYYQVKVRFIEEPLGDGRINIIIAIDEGSVTHIQRIRFIGNNMFSDADLRDAIASRQSDIGSWMSSRDVFERKRFGADAQMLIQHYLEQGYLDAKIESTNLAMSSDKKSFNLTFSVKEGPQYKVAGIDLQGDLVPNKEVLNKLITLEAGKIFAQSKLVASVLKLTERVGDEGFAFATVTPLFKRNSNHTVNITFDIEKGRKVYIDKILISGNEKTVDPVIRRELKQHEGAQYTANQINRSKERIKRSPFVEDVRVSLPKGRDSDKVDMKIDVTEKKTGSFTFGIGYSALEKLIFSIKLSEDNLFGKGYRAQADGTIGAKTKNFTTSFTDPYFLGKNMSASVNAFNSKSDPLTTTQTYSQDSSGGGFGFNIPLSDHFNYGINYNYEITNLKNVPADSSIILLAQQGKQTAGIISQAITWDDRDRLTATSEGSVEQISLRIAGLGGQERFIESSISASAYFPLDDEQELVFNPSFEARYIRGYSGKNTPLQRRYSMGGNGSLRGFDYAGVSLRDPQSGEALGGDKMLRASLNLLFPLPYIKTSGIRGGLFVDAGLPWGSVDGTFGNQSLSVKEGFSLSRLRTSAGFGLEWLSPVGPITLIWGFPIKTVTGDLEKSFDFAVGGSF